MAPPVHNHSGEQGVYDPDMPPWARRLESSVNRVLMHIEGEPGATEKSLLTRVDRLEQSEQRKGVWVGAAITAGVAGLGAAVWNKLTGKA